MVAADGSTQSVNAVDAFLVNAGATHPPSVWLESLNPGGRLILPLTVEHGDQGPIGMGVVPSAIGTGGVFKLQRCAEGFAAAFISRAWIFHCIGARSERGNELLRDAFRSGNADSVRSLRRDPHEQIESCWLHGKGYCLSTLPPGAY